MPTRLPRLGPGILGAGVADLMGFPGSTAPPDLEVGSRDQLAAPSCRN